MTMLHKVSALVRWTSHLACGVALSVSALSLLPQISLAQTNVQPLQDFQTRDGGQDPFSNRSGNGSSSLFELLHRANLGSPQNLDDYTLEQRENLNSAAQEFRLRQIEALKKREQQAAPTPASADTVPASTSN